MRPRPCPAATARDRQIARRIRRRKEEESRRVYSEASMPKCIQVSSGRLHTQYHRVSCISSLHLRNYRTLEVSKLAKCPPHSGRQLVCTQLHTQYLSASKVIW